MFIRPIKLLGLQLTWNLEILGYSKRNFKRRQHRKFVENINVEHFQEILCTTVKELECVKNLTTKGDDQSRHTDCSKKCSGLFVSSYTKTNRSREDFFLQFNSLLRNYSEYKGSDLTNKAPKLNGTEEQNLLDKLYVIF